MTTTEGYSPSIVEDSYETTKPIVDYWSGRPEPRRWYFPDGVQFLQFEPLTYGKRKQYQSATAQDVNMNRRDQNIKIRANISNENHELIVISTVDWYVVRDGKPVTFSKSGLGGTLQQFLEQFPNPAILDDYLKELRDANPWLLGEVSAQDIRDQIEQLQQALVEAEEREAGK